MNALIDVHTEKGVLVTTSRNVAEVFGKEHKNVLRDIENIISQLSEGQSSDLSSGLNKPFVGGEVVVSGLFVSSVYKTEPNGRDYPEYLITRDGLTLLVMGYTGEKAMMFKLAYIKRFNEMEAKLREPQQRIAGDLTPTLSNARFLLEAAGIVGNQQVIALDNVVRAKTGESLLALTGVQLVAPQPKQLLTPTQLGQSKGLSGIKVNKRLAELGYQIKTEAGWEPTELGLTKGAVMQDTGKKHGNGTPVRQLKWPSDLEI